MADLSRLFRPRSIVVLGGWWADNVVAQCVKSGFDGDIWPVHPKRETMAGIPCLRSLDDLPQAARDYIARIEAVVGAPIDIISTGPDRVETIILRHPFD